MSVLIHQTVHNLYMPSTDPRPARSRALIVTAALQHFLAHGYANGSVDAIAAEAGVSKRTIYNLFESKEEVFRAVVEESFRIAEQFTAGLAAASLAPTSAEAPGRPIAETLEELAVAHAQAVLDPRVIRLRRLLIGEAERFPELAAEYYERAPQAVITALEQVLRRHGESGELSIPDELVPIAAEQFAFLVLGVRLDRALFFSAEDAELAAAPEVAGRARAGARAFLRAYAADGQR